MRHSRRYDFQGHPRSGQGHVRLKVSKMTIFKIYLLRHFLTSKKIPTVSDTRPKYLKPFRPDFLISSQLSSHLTSKFAKKSTLSNINETWYDVRGRRNIHDDMTLKVIRGQSQGEMTSVCYRNYFLYYQPLRFLSVQQCISRFLTGLSPLLSVGLSVQ